MSPYDPCVWNVDVDHKQLTINFRVDDLMMAHEGSNEVSKCISMLDKAHGAKDALAVTRRKMHKYLGIKRNGMKMGVSITQYYFIKKMHSKIPDDLKVPCKATPEPEDLFKVDCKALDLNKIKNSNVTRQHPIIYF